MDFREPELKSNEILLPHSKDLIRKDVITLHPESDIHQAIQTFIKNKIAGAPVLDENGILIGMLSEKDCLGILIQDAMNPIPSSTVKHYMTQENIMSISADVDLLDLAELFKNHPFRHLPVIDERHFFLGMISRGAVLGALEKYNDSIRTGFHMHHH